MAKLVSKTYGDALFEVALEKNQLDEFLDEVKAAQTAIEENKELFKLMSHPKIVKEEKIKIITDIFTGKVSEELVGLLRMIVDKGHFEQVDSVFTYFIDEVKEYKNIGTAYVTSAMAQLRSCQGTAHSFQRTAVSFLAVPTVPPVLLCWQKSSFCQK